MLPKDYKRDYTKCYVILQMSKLNVCLISDIMLSLTAKIFQTLLNYQRMDVKKKKKITSRQY